MSSKVYNFSSDYDIETQKRCYNCGYVYDKTPEYEYDTWNLGHYGCTEPKRYIKKYKDEGCPYCKERKKKAINKQISEYEDELKRCHICGKAKISPNIRNDGYCIECDCIMTQKYVSLEHIPKLIDIWNNLHFFM